MCKIKCFICDQVSVTKNCDLFKKNKILNCSKFKLFYNYNTINKVLIKNKKIYRKNPEIFLK